MSQNKLKPHISTSEKLRARGLIDETIKQTNAAQGRTVVARYGRFLVGVGFGIGLLFAGVVYVLMERW